MKEYDIVIIGAGPAGLNCALKLKQENKELSVAVIDKGEKLENRKQSSIEGIGGAGAYSDFKFTLTNDFGGYLWEKIGKEKSLKLQKEIDEINKNIYNNAYSETPPKLYSSNNSVYKKICTQHNLHLLNANIRHWGTDLGQKVYFKLYENLANFYKVDFFTNVEITNIVFDKYDYITTTSANEEFKSKYVVVAAGRSGSKWVRSICNKLGISTVSNKVDIGVRFECPNEIWDHITKDLYECKIVYHTKTYEDDVRTFCMNPSGLVAVENTKNGITVNGHAYEDQIKKTNNTNFALLVNKTFTKPFNNSNDYGEAVVKLSNMLGGGVIVQRYGDLIRGKRSTKDRIAHNTVIPTLNAEPGDLSLVLPKRILDDIVEMIEALNHLVPGMTNDDNLLYGVEVKYYNSVVKTNNKCEALDNLFFIGDGSGLTHSLSQASANGRYVAEVILDYEKTSKRTI